MENFVEQYGEKYNLLSRSKILKKKIDWSDIWGSTHKWQSSEQVQNDSA